MLRVDNRLARSDRQNWLLIIAEAESGKEKKECIRATDLGNLVDLISSIEATRILNELSYLPPPLSQTSGPDQMDGKQLEFTRIWPKIVINELKYVSFISLDLIRYSHSIIPDLIHYTSRFMRMNV